ncbi:major facilitator superfamily domain-containing protein [Podospora australis]|uniref:Major facilitator superfamily domain-containing protein n=1 Tax=Podospora australis TaxID=1536484 RepID=A0AAN7AGW2_9PEZI|nr:major facilitator superfamily domain-containing protein [Podospora australis]
MPSTGYSDGILFICWIEAGVRLTLFSSIFTCFGGGNTVVTAASMMILADSTPDVSRSRIFFYASTSLTVGQILGPPLGAVLMAKDPWITDMIGFLCVVPVPGIACLAPETLDNTNLSAIPDEDSPRNGDVVRYSIMTRLVRSVQHVFRHAVTTLASVFHSRNLAVLIATYFTVDFARETLSLIMRCVSARFKIPLAKASYILSFKATGHLLAFAVLLPLFDTALARYYRHSSLGPHKKDLTLARISIVFITSGYAILVLSPALVGILVGIGVSTLGTGFQAAIKSLLSSMVDKDMVGTVFTTLSLMDTVGALFAGRIDALVIKQALRMEGVWQSLPFIFALVLCAVSTLVLGYVRVDHVVPLS